MPVFLLLLPLLVPLTLAGLLTWLWIGHDGIRM